MPERTTLHDDDKMPWGKYKGQRLGDVPDWYWRWLARQDWVKKHPQLLDYANLVEDDE